MYYDLTEKQCQRNESYIKDSHTYPFKLFQFTQIQYKNENFNILAEGWNECGIFSGVEADELNSIRT